MGSVFISYSSKDRDRVAVIADTLRTAGFEVWWDREIPVATTYHEHIQKQLQAAQAVVVVWSPASVASQYVLWEAQKAHRRGILVPALIEDADLPPDFFLIQAADLTRWQGSPADPEWKRLTGALSRLVPQDPEEPPVTPVSPALAARPSLAAPEAARTRSTPGSRTRPASVSAAPASRPWYARRWGLATLGGVGLLAVVVAVLVMSGGGTEPTTTLAATTTVVDTTTDSSSTSAAATTTVTVATTTTAPLVVTDLAWSRIWSEGSDVFGGSGAQRMLALVRWGSGFVAVGEDSTPGNLGGAVWKSEDGETWNKVAGSESIGGVMYGIAVGGPGLVAVGVVPEGAGVWTSSDGVIWSADVLEGPGDPRLYSVAAAGSGLVAVGEEGGLGAVWTSADGIVWERVDVEFGAAPAVTSLRSVVADGVLGIVVAGTTWLGGDSDAVVWISEDGVTWERIRSEAFRPGNQWINAITKGGPGLVAVGGAGYAADDVDAVVWVSSDGYEWTRVGDASAMGGEGLQEMFGVAKGDLGQFAVGSDGRGDWDAAVWASSDGMTWERVVVETTAEDPGPFDAGQMQAVVVTDSRVVGVGVIDWQTGEVVPGQSIGAGQELDAVAWVGLPVGSG